MSTSPSDSTGSGASPGSTSDEPEAAAAPESDTPDTDAMVDEWGAESFPASDPPNSWAGPPPPS